MVRRRSTVRFRIGAQTEKASALGGGLCHVRGSGPGSPGPGSVGGQSRPRAWPGSPCRPTGRRRRSVRPRAWMRAATAPAVSPVQVVRTSARPSSPEHAGALAAFGDAVGDAEQDVARVEGDGLLVQLQVLHDAEQRLGFGGRLDRAVLAQAQRQRMAGADDLQHGAAVLLAATARRRGGSGSGCGRPRRGWRR